MSCKTHSSLCFWLTVQTKSFLVLTALTVATGWSGSVFVDRNSPNPDPPFSSWATAATHIQEAVDQAEDNDTVWIRQGRYTLPPVHTNFLGPNVVYLNRPMTLRSESGNPSDVRIDGEGQNRVITIDSPSGDGTTFALIGLTLTNGFTTNNGGGLLLSGSDGAWHTDVLDCVITHNVSTANDSDNDGGGGIYGRWTTGYSSILLSNTVLRANEATRCGGGLYYRVNSIVGQTDGARLIDCIIEYNRSVGRSGGGVFRQPHAHMHFERTIIRHNTAGFLGGAMDMRGDGNFLMRNCLVHDNSTSWGALYMADGPVKVIENSTIVYNGVSTGRGITFAGGPNNTLQMKNSIVYANGEINLFFGNDDLRDASLILHSLISPTNDLPGAANLDINPAFVDVAGGDFRLTQDSPAVNAGTNLTWMLDGVDLVGNPRLDGLYRQADIGAYEYHYRGTTIMVR